MNKLFSAFYIVSTTPRPTTFTQGNMITHIVNILDMPKIITLINTRSNSVFLPFS